MTFKINIVMGSLAQNGKFSQYKDAWKTIVDGTLCEYAKFANGT